MSYAFTYIEKYGSKGAPPRNLYQRHEQWKKHVIKDLITATPVCYRDDLFSG